MDLIAWDGLGLLTHCEIPASEVFIHFFASALRRVHTQVRLKFEA